MISREDAIKFFDFYNDEDCFTEKCIEAHKKAISDMQKIEQIEQIFLKNTKKYCGSCSNYGETCFGDSEEIEKCKYVEIEQIIKGEE